MPIIAKYDISMCFYGLRKNNTAHKEAAQKIVSKHGSRRPGLPRTVEKRKTSNAAQGEHPL